MLCWRSRYTLNCLMISEKGQPSHSTDSSRNPKKSNNQDDYIVRKFIVGFPAHNSLLFIRSCTIDHSAEDSARLCQITHWAVRNNAYIPGEVGHISYKNCIRVSGCQIYLRPRLRLLILPVVLPIKLYWDSKCQLMCSHDDDVSMDIRLRDC